MNETTTIPAIISFTLTPNPAIAGQPVLVTVKAVEVTVVPQPFTAYAGEFSAGEV